MRGMAERIMDMRKELKESLARNGTYIIILTCYIAQVKI